MGIYVTDNIKFIGIDDASCRIFEAQYPTPLGMSYNSYVIVDEKIAVMDSVEENGGDQWLTDILAATEGRTPDYLVVHHMEPDHSACIARAMHHFPEMKIVTGVQAAKMLPQFFPDENFDGRVITVKEGDTLSLGTHELHFYSAPMVHWPEVMVSYESNTRTLFSADAFGKFGALQYADDWVGEARRYYLNIVGRYGQQVQALLKKLVPVTIDRIAPLHGPVLSAPLDRYLRLYDLWSRYQPETRGVMIAYASIYGGTAAAALELADMLRRAGIQVAVMDLTKCDMSEAVAQAFRLSHLVLATPTYDSGIFPVMHDFIHHLSLKNFRNRIVGYIENGSWAPTAAKRMSALMATMPDITELTPTVTIRSRLDENSRRQLATLADTLVTSLSEQEKH